ncbi:MAG: phosphoribosyl-AMP cyclohydrolase [Deltaproteobacteria bacterium]|nr:phosphoribosyl-AMP cyclohydrolase [Deltaproteobacteria bacterium]
MPLPAQSSPAQTAQPLDFSKGGGMIPAIVQDWQTHEVLMVAYLNEEAFRLTQETGKMHYYSRSRNRLWMKGESSGHVQEVKEILVDCDQDAVVFKIHQVGGAACHEGYNSCFFRKMEKNGSLTLIKQQRVFDPETVYKK